MNDGNLERHGHPRESEPEEPLSSPGLPQPARVDSRPPLTEKERQRIRFAAADELSWGGPGPEVDLPARPFPSEWTDVTDVVLAQLEQARRRRG